MVLRNLIVGYIMKDKTDSIKLPKDLTTLLLKLTIPEGSSDNLIGRRAWGLKKRSGNHEIAFPVPDEQAVFVSCLQSMPDIAANVPFLQHSMKADLEGEWEALVKNKECLASRSSGIAWVSCVDMTNHRAAAKLLLLALICCVVEAPYLASEIMRLPALLKLQNVSSIAEKHSDRGLLDLLLLIAVHCGDAAVCTQLISDGASPNALGLCLTERDGSLSAMTVLQISLGSCKLTDYKIGPDIIMTLLKAGADPNICGEHQYTPQSRSVCCSMSPIYLASRYSSYILQALLDAGTCKPEDAFFTSMLCEIGDANILSQLLPEMVSPKGRGEHTLSNLFICPLQAVLARGEQGIALKLLEYVESPLGISVTALAEIFKKHYNKLGYRDTSIFYTPLTYAILSDFPDVVDKLLEKGANLNESYLDYLSREDRRLLIPRGYDLTFLSYLERISKSPLQAAVYEKNLRAVKFLLRAGADPNHRHVFDFSMLALAMWHQDQTITELLRRHGAVSFWTDLLQYNEWATSGHGYDYYRRWVQVEPMEEPHTSVKATRALYEKIQLYYGHGVVISFSHSLPIPEQFLGDFEQLIHQWRLLDDIISLSKSDST